jgi:hypothetical protein
MNRAAAVLLALATPGCRAPPPAEPQAVAVGAGTTAAVIATDIPRPELVEVRPSLIPGAGQGLFAKVDIPIGAYIGDYTGRYITPEETDAEQGTHAGAYIFFIPPCAKVEEYDAILGDPEHYISKVNYAPAVINGHKTNLQNAQFDLMCEEPYVRLHAIRPIPADAELYADYGEDYDYAFMAFPEVQEYLLRAAHIEPREHFTWDYWDRQE